MSDVVGRGRERAHMGNRAGRRLWLRSPWAGMGQARRHRLVSLLLAVLLLMMTGDRVTAQFFPDLEPNQDEITFGCEPGPVEPFVHADPPVMSPPVASRRDTVREASLRVDTTAGRQVDGHGFNLEHTLWSCPAFRRVLRRSFLTTFQPDIARVDSGQLPFAPESAPASALSPEVYQTLMDDPKYAPGWSMLRLLNRQNVRLMLGVWGGPGQFTDDGTRRGELLPQYVDAYADYVTAVVDYLVRRQNVTIWSVTVANEPDGGDGTLIPPDRYVEVARKLGPRLAPYGVTLNGPDTASAANAMPYLDRLLAEPDLLQYFGAITTHEYFTESSMAELVQRVHETRPGLSVYATEYTSFRFGAMDRGQEATNEIGHMIDSLQVYASLMNAGADAAIYWDAVDYYQAGHAAITRWGLLQGPSEAFAPRTRYYGFAQILPYVQAGSVILPTDLSGPSRLAALAVGGGSRRPGDVAIAALNRSGPVELTMTIAGPAPPTFEVWVTDVDRDFEHLGRVSVKDGQVTTLVPARSVTTFTASPPPDEELGE